MTLSAIPAWSRVTETTSRNSSPFTTAARGGKLEERHETADGALERAVGEPRPRGVPARAVERELGDDVAEAPGLDREVRRLEHDRERGLVHELRSRRRAQGAGCARPAAPRDRRAEARRRSGRGAGSSSRDELDRDREPALHVARADAVHGAVRDAPRKVVLRRDGVVVGCEHDQRRPGRRGRREEERLVARELGRPAVRNELEQTLADRLLRAALRRDVHELERPRGETVGERGHRRSVPRHNLAVTARQPDPAPGAEPERAFLVGVYPKGSDGAGELDELRELARTSGAVPVGEIVQHRGQSRPSDVPRQGEARRAERGLRTSIVRGAARRRRAEPDAAAVARGRARRARRRPHAADPRHLRPARPELRGQAPGRARAARVQPSAHARHVEAPRAPRRRGGDARSGRVAARDRPPPRANPRLAPQAAPPDAAGPALDQAQGAAARGQPDDRARRLHERRQVDAPERAHRRARIRRRPALRDARPDHARRSSTTASATSSPTRSGFIRRLPTQLVEGFAATLEETLVADLVLHVADASLPEKRLAETIGAVTTVLARDRCRRHPGRARPEQGRRARPARPAAHRARVSARAPRSPRTPARASTR